MNMNNINGVMVSPSSMSLGGKLREARIAAITAKAAEEALACEAVSQIEKLLADAGLLEIARSTKKKMLLLPRNYAMWLENTHRGEEWVLIGNGSHIASGRGTLYEGHICGEEAFDQFVLDIDNGLLGEIASFVTAATSKDQVPSRKRGIPHRPDKQKPQVVEAMHGAKIPLRSGWDYEGAELLENGTLIVPRERTFQCPPDVELPRAASGAGNCVGSVRFALAHRGNVCWLTVLGDGYSMPDCTLSHLWGETCDHSGEHSVAPEFSEDVEGEMISVESIEFEVEKKWAVRWTRATVAQEINGR